MKFNQAPWSDSLPIAVQMLRGRFLPLLGLFAVSNTISMSLEHLVSELGKGDDQLRLILQLSIGITDLTESFVLMLLLSWSIGEFLPLKTPPFEKDPFSKPYLSSFFAESLRQIGWVLLYGLLLIIPGFIVYCRLIFVPVIALFSEKYRKGEIDALQLSRKLAKGRTWLIAVVLLGTGFIQTAIEFIPNVFLQFHSIPIRILFQAASFSIAIWSYTFLFLLFKKALEEVEWN